MERLMRREHLAKMIHKSRSLLDNTLRPATIRCPDRGYRTLGSFETLSKLPEGSVIRRDLSDIFFKGGVPGVPQGSL
jgi:hypothetical protein